MPEFCRAHGGPESRPAVLELVIATSKEPEEVCVVKKSGDRLDRGRHIGHRGRSEDGGNPGRLPGVGHDAHLRQRDLGSTRGIELHRESDDLKDDDGPEEEETEQGQIGHLQKKPDEEKRHSQPGTDGGGRHVGGSEGQGGVLARVLDRGWFGRMMGGVPCIIALVWALLVGYMTPHPPPAAARKL